MPSKPAPLTPDEHETIYRTLVQPVLFDAAPGGHDKPTLVLLGGQPGAGKSRSTARLLAEYDGMVALTGDDLRIFHPQFRSLVTEQPEQAGSILAEATRGWVRAALDDALTRRHSLLLEGTFGDPDTTLATATRFRDAGFHVRIIAVASPRVLSIVSAASRYLRDRKLGTPARFTRLSAHDRGYHGTTRLIDSLQSSSPTARVTIISRNGNVLYDREHDNMDSTISDAATALHDGRQPASWGARSTMELLGELKQITGYAISSGQLTPEFAELLDHAHQLTLAEVIPKLSVAPDSPQARFIQQAVSEQLVALRRAAEPAGRLDANLTPRPEVAAARLELG
ncbi:MAG TPA: zeta toxin family protein [Terrimesophilobacter sp.]|nr:zeta toxin family protein [Terrimesophilobacter sp.]